MNAEQRQTAADPWTKPTDFSTGPTVGSYETMKLSLPSLLLSPKADSQRTEGRVDLDGWLYTKKSFIYYNYF